MKVDMHIHTLASDGTWTAEELVENIIENKISIFSVTDYDSIENVENIANISFKKEA